MNALPPAPEHPQLTPEQLRALGHLAKKAVNLNSLRGDKLPTAEAGAALLRGDMTQLVPATAMFLGRALQIGTGIWISGEWGENSVKNALAGSAAVQAFLFLWVAMNKDKDLPSGDSAQSLVSGDSGAMTRVAAHWAARSGIIALGMYASGQRKELAKQALLGGAVIEAAVLSWALTQKKNRETEKILAGYGWSP